ncbi:MAG: DciA family protein [Arenicellales bacterium]
MHRADRLKSFASLEQTLRRCQHPVLKEAVKRYEALTPLETVWKRSVDEPLCKHARPVALDRGTLTIHSESPVWANLLRNTEQSVVSALRDAGLTGVLSLRIRIAPPAASLPTSSSRADSKPGAGRHAADDPQTKRLFMQLRKALG